MANLQLSEQVDAPVERVFAFATDLSRAAEHIAGIDKIELLTAGSMDVGTRWRETRTMFGRQATEELEVTEYHPPSGERTPASYTAECESCGCHFRSRFTFMPQEAGTRVELTLATEAKSLMAKLMSPLSALTMGGAKQAMQQDLADLKRVAES